MGRKGQNKIPDRWEQYSKLGGRIPGTHFICLKVPLKEEMVKNKALKRTEWFTPADLLSELARQGLQLGMLVDLTNTDRYYDPKEITYTGVRYVKINVAGQDLPSLKEVKEFFDAVDEFSSNRVVDTAGVDLLIGVHCTHGVNRTGYLVCRYLIERKGWTAAKAVHEFNNARGHQIEREGYLSALHQAERTFNKTKRAEIDITPINLESSSSSEDEAEKKVEVTTAATLDPTSTFATANMSSASVPAANWQLLQQMMMGVAQMQAMMRMPFAGTAVTGASAAAGEESSDEEETDSSDESDDEDSDESTTSSGEEGSETKAKSVAGGPEEATNSRQGWELGGKVELKPKATTAQKRRARRRNLREEYKKMRKGKFWEIREMQKKKYGI